jgi:ADP-ribosyl-[dinitrogen reductase] hydrolase
MTESLRDAVVGSLTCLAAGDCLGLPVEGSRPDWIRAAYGTLRDFQWPQPVWSDDTQQALALLEVLVREGRVSPEAVGQALVARLQAAPERRFGLHRGTGRGFRHAVRAYAADGDWRASANPERIGNGASMRIAPLAARLRDLDDDAFVSAVVDASVVTHRDARSLAAAVAVARAAQHAARVEAELPLTGLMREVAALAEEDGRRIGSHLPDCLAGMEHVLDVAALLARLADAGSASPEGLLAIIERNVNEVRGGERLATDGYALASPIAAIVIAEHAADVDDALVTAVNLGGDADTTAAMVGGIVGAAVGPEGLPERLRGFPGYDALVAWAAASVDGNDGSLPDLLELERELCGIRDR